MDLRPSTISWLLDADPALRWQVERDVLGLPDEVWRTTRARVATEGFGARVLAAQDPDGRWAGGAFFHAGSFGSAEADEPGQPWTATTWALKDLREWGVDASVLGDTAARLDSVCRWEYDDLPYWGGEVDVCITAYTLASGAWLGADVSAIASWFPEHRLADGGWNCEAEEHRSSRSSFHSTLNAVRGILSYETTTGDTATRAARHAGEEYLLRTEASPPRVEGGPSGTSSHGSPIRAGTATAPSPPSTTSGTSPCSRARHPMRGSPTPSPSSGPCGATTGHGPSRTRCRAAPGSTSTTGERGGPRDG